MRNPNLGAMTIDSAPNINSANISTSLLNKNNDKTLSNQTS